jgi:prepilin-type N-terminal cleavage/methylation domain-containing protein
MLSLRLPGFHQPSIARDEKGFTLIEVLIAIALSALIVSGVLITIGTASKMLVRTKQQETAKEIASADMEYLRSLAFGNNSLAGMPASPSNYSGFSSAVVVNQLQLKEEEIIITVTWNGGSYTLTDYRVDY